LSFLFAQAFYPGLAKLASIRKSIDSPTLFNMLGPLLNPAPITHQLMGIYDQSLSANAIEALKNRGVKAAFVVHGSDGLDELTLSGGTHVTELRNGSVRSFTLSPNDFNLKTAQLSEVKGGTPEENATLIRKIFAGEKSAKRDLVVLNAAAAIVLSDKELSYKNAVNLVCEAIDSGKTLAFLDSLQINAGTAS
jgi:anthranilate phosphoribosyltransferase